MRRLLYVPIIHEGVDLGGAGAAVARGSAGRAGADRWARHQEVLRRFWQEVEGCLRAFDPRCLVLYQDGLPAEGEAGRRIVQVAASRGSANYQLLLRLLAEGARLVQTEAPELLLEEYARMVSSGCGGDQGESERLLERRDDFIAATINRTLGEHEVGLLFIGARHEVGPRLARDIAVTMVKDPQKVQGYVAAVLGSCEGSKELDALAEYVAAPVTPILTA